MRNCPTCQIPLDCRQMAGEEIDICSQCGGTFFDDGELESLVGLFLLYEKVRLDEPEIDSVPTTEKIRQVACPSDGSPMTSEEISGLIIDRCPQCDGIWLDSGELVALQLAQRNIKENIDLYIRLGQ